MFFQFIVFIVAFAISYMLSLFFVKNIYTLRFNEVFARVESPYHKDKRFILKVGGLIIFTSTALAIFIIALFRKDLNITAYDLNKTIGLIAGAAIIFLLGIYDDAKKVGYKGKFVWQLFAVVPLAVSGYSISRISFFGGSIDIHWFGYIFMIMWIVLITNALNIIDGLDGLACGVAVITFGAIALVSHESYPPIVILCLACIGSLLAFLRFNFYPAKLFLGDNGSLLLGYVLAVLSLEINIKMNTLTALSLPVLVLMIPIGSVVYSFLRRIITGRNPFVGDRLHLHYLLLDAGIPHHIVVILFWLSTFVFAMLGVTSSFLGKRFEFFMLSLGVFTVVLAYISTILYLYKKKKQVSRSPH